MTELKIPPRPNLRHYALSREFMRWPGRNHPEVGRWLAETYTKPGDWIVDPMCGVGQMWLSAPKDRHYFIFEREWSAQDIRKPRPVWNGNAETCHLEKIIPALVAFSPPYPQSHNAGATEHQIRMRDEKGDHAIQGFKGPGADMPRVYANIASWGYPRLAVVMRNRIVEGQETQWVLDNAEMIKAAGWTNFEWFWRFVYPTRWQQAKLKRDPSTPVIDKEWIVVATRRRL